MILSLLISLETEAILSKIGVEFSSISTCVHLFHHDFRKILLRSTINSMWYRIKSLSKSWHFHSSRLEIQFTTIWSWYTLPSCWHWTKAHWVRLDIPFLVCINHFILGLPGSRNAYHTLIILALIPRCICDKEILIFLLSRDMKILLGHDAWSLDMLALILGVKWLLLVLKMRFFITNS